MNQKSETIIITIHGIGGTTFPHLPLVNELNEKGYKAYYFGYQSTHMSLTEAAESLNNFIDQIISQKTLAEEESAQGNPEKQELCEENMRVILIGHSAGGRVALTSKHPHICGIITIATPIQGSWLAEKFLYYLPMIKYFYGPMLEDLAQKHSEEIKIPLITISASKFGEFDGRMWKEEMTHESAIMRKHLDNSFHWGYQIMDSRMRDLIVECIEKLLAQ